MKILDNIAQRMKIRQPVNGVLIDPHFMLS